MTILRENGRGLANAKKIKDVLSGRISAEIRDGFITFTMELEEEFFAKRTDL